ncbi:hypothetical protein [Streptomyces sp. NPDC059215]|uniref:hypothetical protein n=1 Tax=Streptomyces sp. NPDC059215 TaxID=3346772 RepID=UPI0036968A78
MAWHRILSSWKGTGVHGQVAAPVGERRLVLRQGSGRALALPAARFEELRTTMSDTVKNSVRHAER